MRVNPFIFVSGGMIVNSGGAVVPGTGVLCNSHVKGNGAVFPKTIVNTVPRSLGFHNRRAATRVNSGGAVHRGMAVGHNATTGNGAVINDGGLLVRKMRMTRSTVVNDNYVVNGTAGVTNRVVVSSGTVVDNTMLVRRFYQMNNCMVMRNNSHFDGSVPPCVVTKHRPVTCTKVGVMKLHHHKFSGRLVRGVRGACHVVCRGNVGIASTLRRMHGRVPVDGRVRCVVSFVRGSRENVVEWRDFLWLCYAGGGLCDVCDVGV